MDLYLPRQTSYIRQCYMVLFMLSRLPPGAREERGATTLILFQYRKSETVKTINGHTHTPTHTASFTFPFFPFSSPPKLNPEEAQRYALYKSSQYQNILSLSLTTHGIHTRFRNAQRAWICMYTLLFCSLT